MKPGEEWTDPNTGKVYVAEKARRQCDGCAAKILKPLCASFPPCFRPNIIFKEKEETK